MDTKDIFTLVVSVLSACAAAYAAVVARAAVHSQRYTQKWVVNHDLLARAAGMLITNPELLKLHGITPEELEKDGVSFEELIYMNVHFDAAAALYKIGGDKHVQLTEFRKNFIRNAKVRTVWKKYLRGKLFSPTPYARAVDAYIAEVEAEENGTAQ